MFLELGVPPQVCLIVNVHSKSTSNIQPISADKVFTSVPSYPSFAAQMIIGATATINLLDAFAVWQFLGTLKSELTLMGRSNTRGGSTGKGQQSRTDESTKVNTTSRVKCFNYVYGHYAAECRKPRRERERERGQTLEVNLAQTQDDEPTLLFTECKEKKGVVVLLNEESVIPIFAPEGNTDVNSNL